MAARDAVSAAGRWLRAAVRDDAESRRIREDVVDEQTLARLVDAAFAIAVARRFTPDCRVQDITRQVLGVRQRYGERSPQVLEMEMVVRRELGETVPIDDLDPVRISLLKVAVLEQFVYDLGLFDDEVDALINQAEAVVREAGTAGQG